MKKNACDFVLANDSAQIGENRHVGYLISADFSWQKLETKAEIAEKIARSVLNLYDRKAGKA